MHPLTTDRPCTLHRWHSPVPKVNHIHHIVPESYGGSDLSSNKTIVCPTSHYNIHDLLAAFEHYSEEPPWEVTQHYSPIERALAREGWEGRTI